MAVPGGVPGGLPMAPDGGVPGLEVCQGRRAASSRLTEFEPAGEARSYLGSGAWPPMPPMMAIQLLTGNGFTARSYYNGVPDLSSREASQVRTRDVIKRKLQTIKLPPMGQDGKGFDGMNMSVVLKYLEDEIKKFDPTGTGISLVINPYIDPVGRLLLRLLHPVEGPGSRGAGRWNGD